MRRLSAVLTILLALASGQALALPGLDGTLWRTTFNVAGGGSATCDVVVNADGTISTYPSGDDDVSDGYLTVDSYTADAEGLANYFKGAWNRGGQSGTYFFNVSYQSGQPSGITGFYTSDNGMGGVEMSWTGTP
jgi:hypothetical protein